MKIKILLRESGDLIDAVIKDGKRMELPCFHDGWRFNFNKQAKGKGTRTYVLVKESAPGFIEGCLIYKMIREVEPYMAFVEIAPHNKGKNKIHDRVAGCLIAFACRLSFIHGAGSYKGWLAFDVQERSPEDELKLMSLYSKRYSAMRIGNTTMMVISPEDGERLIEKYLGK